MEILNHLGKFYLRSIIVVILISLLSSNVISPAVADGVNWTVRTTPNPEVEWRSVTFGQVNGIGIFVAVGLTGAGNRVMTSPDGVTWTARNSAADNQWRSVIYGNGLFVAVSDNNSGTVNDRVMTSPDGINWTSRVAAANNDWYSVTYGNGLYVSVSDDSSGSINDRIMTSPDGITWTSRTAAENHKWHSVTYGLVNGAGLFVAVSTTITPENRVMTSPDGVSWTSQASANNYYWWSVTYGNGVFVAVTYSANDQQVMTSSDGVTWTSRSTAGNSTKRWMSVAYGNSVFVAVSYAGTFNRVISSGVYLLPPSFTLSASSESRTVNTAATGFTINSTGGTVASFSINSVPPGMSFNTSTGALTGTPNSVAPATNYTITGTNSSGSTSQTFNLTVTAAITVENSVSESTAAAAESARRAKEQKELIEILSIIPKIAELTLSLGETTKILTATKCVKGKSTKFVNKGAKCPKGFVRAR